MLKGNFQGKEVPQNYTLLYSIKYRCSYIFLTFIFITTETRNFEASILMVLSFRHTKPLIFAVGEKKEYQHCILKRKQRRQQELV